MSSSMQLSHRLRLLATSPALWATTYLVAIPAFALVYRTTWSDFYQTTARHDSATNELYWALRAAIYPHMDALVKQFPGALQKPYISMIGPDQVDNGYRFTMFLRDKDCCDSDSSYYVSVDFPQVQYPMGRSGADRILHVLPVTLRFSDQHLAQLFRSAPPTQPKEAIFELMSSQEEAPDVLSGDVLLPEGLLDLFRRFDKAMSGYPAPATGGFTRYLYFSAATITTLGYGDIVPLTDRARTLVAIEAILGIVLAGFFVNAVGRKRAV